LTAGFGRIFEQLGVDGGEKDAVGAEARFHYKLAANTGNQHGGGDEQYAGDGDLRSGERVASPAVVAAGSQVAILEAGDKIGLETPPGGTSPKRKALMKERTRLKMSSSRSTRTSKSRGKSEGGRMVLKAAAPPKAKRTPTRDPPSARRTATSRDRARPHASSRLATFTQAMRRTRRVIACMEARRMASGGDWSIRN